MRKNKLIIGIIVAFFLLVSLPSKTKALTYKDFDVFLETELPSYFYQGSCPRTLTFKGEVYSLYPGKIQYRFVRSDGALMPIETVEFNKTYFNTKKIQTNWIMNVTYSGWVQLQMLYPIELQSNKAYFSVKCENENLFPDLAVSLDQSPSSAKAGQNIGSLVRFNVLNYGKAKANKAMVDIILKNSPLASSPSSFAVYSPYYSDGSLLKGGRENVTIDKQGAIIVEPSGSLKIPFNTPEGNYYLCVVADAGNKIRESNETNNYVCKSVFVRR